MDNKNSAFQDLGINREYLYEQIADKLQNAIRSGQLRSGARLPPERELADMLQVNRATIRDAVRILEHRGIVQRKVGSGTFVTEVPAKVIGDAIERYMVFGAGTREELIVLREILEPAVAALAAQHATTANLDRMESVLQRLAEAYRIKNSEEAAHADADFHVAVAEATQNSLIVVIVNALQQVIEQVVVRRLSNLAPQVFSSRADTMLGLHQGVCDAIRARDSEGARQAILAHFKDAREAYTGAP